MADNSDVAFEIDVGPAGWGSIRLSVGERHVLIAPISDWMDMLGDLARFALAACVGQLHFDCRFDGEPQEHRLIGRRDRPDGTIDHFSVQLLHFRDINARLPDSKGTEYFKATCDPDRLASAALDAIERVGPTRYKLWQRRYPYRVVAALRAALAEDPD